MSVVIRVLGRADGEPTPVAGLFVRWFDVDAAHGRGVCGWATSAHRAKQFNNAAEAFLYWRRQSRAVPLRSDGEPNRPLTAFSIELLKVPDDIEVH